MTPTPPTGGAAFAAPPLVRRLSLAFSLTLLAALIASTLPFPYRLAMAPFALASTVLVTCALWFTFGAGRLIGLRVFLAIGAGISALTLVFGCVYAMFPDEFQELEECRSGAITPAKDRQCQNAFTDAVLGVTADPSAPPSATAGS